MSSRSVNSTLGPAQQVFNTTELLEIILSFLPMPQILGKSRVARNWKAVIDNSPALQRQLFLRHDDSHVEVLGLDHLFPKRQDWSQDWLHGLDYGQLNFIVSLEDMPVYTTPVKLNPLLNWENQANLHVAHEIAVAHPKPFDPCLAKLGVVLGKYSTAYIRHRFGQSWQREQFNSSWCKMYLTTPPIASIVIHVPTTVGSGGFVVGQGEHIRVNIHSENGVTLGILRGRVEDTLKEFRMKDGRHRAQIRKEGPLKEKDFVKGWGKKEQVMFLVQPEEDHPDLELQ